MPKSLYRLDILVEMARHTSANRLSDEGKHRLATVQLTGIGDIHLRPALEY